MLTPTSMAAGGGYAGDIASGPEGGFVLSCQRASMAVHWGPAAPADLVAVAQLQEVCALAPWPSAMKSQGVLSGVASGLGRWHPTMAAGFLRSPSAMAPDNHWVLV